MNCWRTGKPEISSSLAITICGNSAPDHTLQSTALGHEAYLRLANQKNLHFGNRNRFFALAALIMRQILVDYARACEAAKRAGGAG